jgi:molecular chaperone DnaJ
VHKEKTLQVDIPPGVDTGTHLRMAGEGEPGSNGGPPGDLYVVLTVREHPFFERRNDDLHCTIPINVAQAALGADIQVPTLEGPETIHIPEGTQNGATFRLRNRGVPHLNRSGRGDLIVHIEVKVPTRLTREQRKLFEQLRDTLPAENQPKSKGIFEKVKDYFQ